MAGRIQFSAARLPFGSLAFVESVKSELGSKAAHRAIEHITEREIDKLVQSERAKLENRDKENAEVDEQTRLRFKPLKLLLIEIVKSFHAKYIKAHFGEMAATIEIDHTTWNITPNRQFNFGKNVYQLKDGFETKETSHYDFSGFQEAETTEQTKMFPDEQDVARYLTAEIAKKVAYHQHRNKGKV